MGKWIKKSLIDCCNVYDNLRVPITAQFREDGDTPYYGANGIQDYVNGFTHCGEFVLVAEDGANDLIDYPVQYVNGLLWVNNHAHVIQGKNILINKFLAYFLKRYSYVNILTGGTRAKLNGSALKKIAISYPTDIAEQGKIADILSTIDEMIAKTRAIIEKHIAIKRGLMQNLLSQGEETSLMRCCKIVAGSTPSTSNELFWNGENVWLTPKDLSTLTTPYIDTSIRKLSHIGVKQATGVLLPANSVIISNRAPVGYCAIPTVPFSFNQGCKGLLCNQNIYPLYLYYFLCTSTAKLERVSSGTTFLEISKKELKRFVIRIPKTIDEQIDFDKQKKIADKIYAADKRIQTERDYLAKLLDIKKGLMHDLLTNVVSVDALLKEDSSNVGKTV